MNTSVDFSIAKLLKEKGWNIFTSNFWKNPNGVPSLHKGVFNYNNRAREDGTELPAFSAPTIAEVVMWLYEEHGIWIEVALGYDENTSWFVYYINSLERGALYEDDETQFKTPNKAYEAAIDYTLNNLI